MGGKRQTQGQPPGRRGLLRDSSQARKQLLALITSAPLASYALGRWSSARHSEANCTGSAWLVRSCRQGRCVQWVAAVSQQAACSTAVQHQHQQTRIP